MTMFRASTSITVKMPVQKVEKEKRATNISKEKRKFYSLLKFIVISNLSLYKEHNNYFII